MKNMVKLGLILAFYAAAACVLLALVNNATAPIIKRQQSAELTAGLAVVFEDADSFEQAADFSPQQSGTVSVDSLYLAKKDGQVVGAVVQASGATYDRATVLLGITLHRQITAVRFLELTDTPGFGQKAGEPSFYNQFSGKSVDDAFEAGADVDMITGATITTRAVANIFKYAAYTAGEYLANNYGGMRGDGEAPTIAGPAAAFSAEAAFEELFPGAVYEDLMRMDTIDWDNPDIEIVQNAVILRKTLAHSADGNLLGALVVVNGPTYKEGGVTITAVDMNGVIVGARITELNDTPNIGQLVLEKDFYSQFSGKSIDASLKTGADIDAVSGATISSACIADMVKIGAVEGARLLTAYGAQLSVPENYELNGISQD